ncbi:MAG: hypothetical protein ACD_22C00047G0012 [uncultured bacterium]|nr:MAG: hypothetical protein ACD_22C00047G0012 [uncultured bacterium]
MQKDEVVSNLKELANKLKHKKYLTAQDIRSVPKLKYYIFVHFRTLGNALNAAGVPSSKLASSMSISNEDLLSYLKDLHNEIGHTPKVWDIEHDSKVYKKYASKKFSWKVFKTRFNGLKKAIELSENKDVKSKRDAASVVTKKVSDEDQDFFQSKRKFWGRAAELHVTAELLYHGFQAANIPVDVGLDVLAVKKNKTFYFQVKHKDLSNYDAIKLTKSSFDRSGGGDVYYIFVLLSEERRNFLIVPYHIVNDWIRVGIAEEKENDYLVYIKKDSDGFKLKDISLNKYLERWEDIK